METCHRRRVQCFYKKIILGLWFLFLWIGKLLAANGFFKFKRNVDGFVARYKTRLVAKSYNQLVGFDFTETFSLVVKPIIICVVLTIALLRQWPIR